MSFDDSSYLLLESATGGLWCRYIPIPKRWNSVDRPHVALIFPRPHGIHRTILSEPVSQGCKDCELTVKGLESLDAGSIIEVRHSAQHIVYYRRETGYWTKIAEATDPFILDVFSNALHPIEIELGKIYSE